MMIFQVYQAPYKPLPNWISNVLALLILPPMILAMIVWQVWKRVRA